MRRPALGGLFRCLWLNGTKYCMISGYLLFITNHTKPIFIFYVLVLKYLTGQATMWHKLPIGKYSAAKIYFSETQPCIASCRINYFKLI